MSHAVLAWFDDLTLLRLAERMELQLAHVPAAYFSARGERYDVVVEEVERRHPELGEAIDRWARNDHDLRSILHVLQDELFG
jgi:hypothetical protein